MIKKIIIAVSVVLCIGVGFADGADLKAKLSDGEAEAIIRGLQKKYESMNSLSANFTEEVFYEAVNQSAVATGRVYLKRPGQMRWNYIEPEAEEVVSDGKTFWVYQPELNQVIITPAGGGHASGAMVDFLAEMVDIESKFKVKVLKDTEVELTPKSPDESLKSLTLTFDKDFVIVKAVVQDTYGGRTTINFRDVTVNPKLSDSLFTFKAPKGVNVIRP